MSEFEANVAQDLPEVHGRLKESIMIATTFGRLALVPELVQSIGDSASRTTVMVGAVVVADILDGVGARALGVDSNSRRIADAVVDRVTMWSAFGAAIAHNTDVLAWYAPLATRGVVMTVGSNLCFWRRNKLVLGGHFHKLASLSQAALGVGLVSNLKPSVLIPTAAVTYGINLTSAADYFGAHRKVMKEPKAPKLERTKIRKLAGLKSLFVSSY